MSGTTTNVSINVLCDQRKKRMLFLNPQTRYTPISPYNGSYTKYQLDMRRKAEILKYSNNSSSSKTNNLTKAQTFVQLVTTRRRYTSQTCPKDRLIPTPSSSSGVPGPIVNLIDDETVPLYNFINYSINDAAYSQSQTENNVPWELNTTNNVYLSRVVSTYSNIGSFYITNFVLQPSYIYTLKIPLGAYANDATANAYNRIAKIYINKINFIAAYSNNNLPINYSASLLRYPLNTIIQIPYTKLSTPINGYTYFAYVDTIIITGISLTTTPGYVYDFNLNLKVDPDITNTNLFANYDNSSLTSKLTISV
jgi:hypothetical protein